MRRGGARRRGERRLRGWGPLWLRGRAHARDRPPDAACRRASARGVAAGRGVARGARGAGAIWIFQRPAASATVRPTDEASTNASTTCPCARPEPYATYGRAACAEAGGAVPIVTALPRSASARTSAIRYPPVIPSSIHPTQLPAVCASHTFDGPLDHPQTASMTIVAPAPAAPHPDRPAFAWTRPLNRPHATRGAFDAWRNGGVV